MKKEIKSYIITCDLCGDNLGVLDKTSSKTSSKYFIKKNNIDLCFSCGGKLFNRNIVDNIKAEKLKDWIEDFNPNTKPKEIIPLIDNKVNNNSKELIKLEDL